MSERLFDVEPVLHHWQTLSVPLTDPATNTLGAVHELAGDTEGAAAALVAPSGWIEDSGERHPTDSGTKAIAWKLSERGRDEWERMPR